MYEQTATFSFTDTDAWGNPCRKVKVDIHSPDGEDWGKREVWVYPDHQEYNRPYNAGGTHVDSYWS